MSLKILQNQNQSRLLKKRVVLLLLCDFAQLEIMLIEFNLDCRTKCIFEVKLLGRQVGFFLGAKVYKRFAHGLVVRSALDLCTQDLAILPANIGELLVGELPS
jgi:hypothetical protein